MRRWALRLAAIVALALGWAACLAPLPAHADPLPREMPACRAVDGSTGRCWTVAAGLVAERYRLQVNGLERELAAITQAANAEKHAAEMASADSLRLSSTLTERNERVLNLEAELAERSTVPSWAWVALGGGGLLVLEVVAVVVLWALLG